MDERGCGEAYYAAAYHGVGHGNGWQHRAFARQGLSAQPVLSFGQPWVRGDRQDGQSCS